MKRAEYFVSGIIQIRVLATSAEHAVVIATERADRMQTRTAYVTVGLDNIAKGNGPTVALEEAATVDED